MRFTFNVSDDGFLIRRTSLDHQVNVPESDDHADRQKQEHEVMIIRSQFPVQPGSEIEPTENGQYHRDSDGACVGQLDQGLPV